MSRHLRIAVLISGSGSNLKAIIDACNEGRISGEVVCVAADNFDASGFQWAKAQKIPTFVVDYHKIIHQYQKDPDAWPPPTNVDIGDMIKRQSIVSPKWTTDRLTAFFTTRTIAEKRLLNQLSVYPFDLLVLAGFMRNLTPYFIDAINTDPMRPRIMNIHPSLLPAFGGVDGYGDTFRYGCKVAGCTVHFVDYGEDSGPIIAQKCFEIQPDDTLDDIRRRGLELEWIAYPHCIQLFAEKRLRLKIRSHTLPGGKTVERAVVQIVKNNESA